MIFIVLKHQKCKNIQNFKSNNNSTSEQKLVNNSYTHTYNVTSKVTLNNDFCNRKRVCGAYGRGVGAYRILVEKRKGKNHWGDLSIDG